MLSAEGNFFTPDKKILAVVYYIEHLRYYFEGKQLLINVQSDHKNFTTFLTTKTSFLHQMRWFELLSGYNFDIAYLNYLKSCWWFISAFQLQEKDLRCSWSQIIGKIERVKENEEIYSWWYLRTKTNSNAAIKSKH